MSDYSENELAVLQRALSAWEELVVHLADGGFAPNSWKFHIRRELEDHPLGWIGYDEDGTVVYRPLGGSDE